MANVDLENEKDIRRPPPMRIFPLATIIILIGLSVCLATLYIEYANLFPNAEIKKYLLEIFKFSMSTVLVAGVAVVYNEYREKIRREDEVIRERESENRKRQEKLIQERQADRAFKAQERRLAVDLELQQKREEAEKRLQDEKESAEKRLQQEKEKAAIRLKKIEIARERLEAFLKEFTRTYNDIKLVRRELRRDITKRDASYVIDSESYSKLMKVLSEKQLLLEQYMRLFRGKPSYIKDISDEALEEIGIAENYIRDVLKEYEEQKLKIHGKVEFNVSKESELFDFVMKRRGDKGNIAERYIVPMENIFNLIYRGI